MTGLTISEGSSSDDSATGFLAGTTALVVALTGATTTEAVLAHFFTGTTTSS